MVQVTGYLTEVSANKAVIIFPSKFTGPLQSGPQARNRWPKQRK